jgi:cytochrome c553
MVLARLIVAAFAACAVGQAADAASPPPPGAASCSGCHAAKPSSTNQLPSLNGRDAGEIAAAVKAFRSGQRQATLMDRLAKGFSDDEIAAIAAWYQAQKE